jgi:hypothetical protein
VCARKWWNLEQTNDVHGAQATQNKRNIHTQENTRNRKWQARMNFLIICTSGYKFTEGNEIICFKTKNIMDNQKWTLEHRFLDESSKNENRDVK